MTLKVNHQFKGRRQSVEMENTFVAEFISGQSKAKVAGVLGADIYAETRPPVLRTGKIHCGRVLICLDGLKKTAFFPARKRLVRSMGVEGGSAPRCKTRFFS